MPPRALSERSEFARMASNQRVGRAGILTCSHSCSCYPVCVTLQQSNRYYKYFTSNIKLQSIQAPYIQIQYSILYFLIIVSILSVFSDLFVCFEAMFLIVFQLRTFVFFTFFSKASVFNYTVAKFIFLSFFFSHPHISLCVSHYSHKNVHIQFINMHVSYIYFIHSNYTKMCKRNLFNSILSVFIIKNRHLSPITQV